MSSKNFMSYEDAVTVLSEFADDIKNKQNTLTAGNNIKINNNNISVNRWAVPAGKVVYTVITSDENYGQNVHVQRHTTGGVFIDDRTFTCVSYTTVTVDDCISIYNPYSSFRIELLKNSDEHPSGYSYTVNPITTPTSNSFTFTVPQEEDDNDLIIRSDLGTAAAKNSTNAVTSGSTDLVESGAVKDAIDAAVASAYHHAGTKTVAQLTNDLLIAANEGNVYNITDSGTTTSDFIEGIGKPINAGDNVGICKVGNAYMFDLLSGFVDTTNFIQKSQTSGLVKNDGTIDTVEKQPKTDNNLQTTSKDTTGAINEIKSDLINYENQNNINLEVPNRKNVFPYPYAGKSSTSFGVTIDVNAERITLDGTATQGFNKVLIGKSSTTWGSLSNAVPLVAVDGKYTFSGMTSNVPLQVKMYRDGSLYSDRILTEPYTYNLKSTDLFEISIKITSGAEYDDTVDIIAPMLEYGETATTFAPYIPSVEDRMESVESGLTKVDNATVLNTQDLTTPSRTKNVLPMTLSGIKALNTDGTWVDNVYTLNGIDYTVDTDASGNVVNITANGTSSDAAFFYVSRGLNYLGKFDGKYTINGGVDGGSNEKYALQIYAEGSGIVVNCYDTNDYRITRSGYTDRDIKSVDIVVRSGVTVENIVFKPMIRLTSIADPTFAPYIQSVESRLNNLTKKAESSSTGTRSEKIDELYSAFSALTPKEKLNSFICDNALISIMKYNTGGAYFDTLPYKDTDNHIKQVHIAIKNSGSEFGSYDFTSGTYTDLSSQSPNTTYCLYTSL